jgi:hypothetical protein
MGVARAREAQWVSAAFGNGLDEGEDLALTFAHVATSVLGGRE